MLKIKNLTIKYGNFTAVDNIDLNVEKGDIFAFIGHNGAGKTTTIKAVVGILDDFSGEILINNNSVKTNPLICKKDIAYVPDNPDIYTSLTGLEYINLVADFFGVEEEERKRIVLDLGDRLNITKDLNNPISTYSHGMRQKVVLISAFVHTPKLLVLDEPFVALDPKASYEVKQIMKEFTQKGGAIFFSTHILEVAEKLCNKVAIIKDGKIIKCGNMAEIKQDKSLENVFLESASE